MAELNRRLTKLLGLLDTTRAALRETTRDINPALATMRPREDEWSAAEVVEHLAIVEDLISRLIAKGVRQARENGAPPAEDESILSSLDKFRITEVVEKITAPDNITPGKEMPIEQSLAVLEQKRTDLRETLIGSADIDLSGITRLHPRFGEFNMYQWAVFVAQHEERHRRQIEKTLDEVTERAAECAPIV